MNFCNHESAESVVEPEQFKNKTFAPQLGMMLVCST